MIVAIVVALYVFVGNSGVISFGQSSFVAVGAFAAGVMTIPLESKTGVLTDLSRSCATTRSGTSLRSCSRPRVGGSLRARRRVPAHAPVRARGGHRHLRAARDHAQHPAQWTKIGPGADDALARARDDGRAAGHARRLVAIAVAFLYQRSRLGRQLRATREDPAAARGVGINVHRQRLWAFTLSGALAGFAGALFVHLLGSITTEQVYLELTFLTLAMLVFGGIGSLWGAVVGALAISGAGLVPEQRRGAESTSASSSTCRPGTRLVFLAAIMALVLILRPSGLTGGREVRCRGAGARRRARRQRRSLPSKTLRGSASSGTPPSAVTSHVSCM